MNENLKVFNLEIFNLKVLLILCAGLFVNYSLNLQARAFDSACDSVKNNNIYLFRAAKNGDLDWVKKLVENKGADINYRTKSGKTVLIKAVTKRRKKIVKYLLLVQDKDIGQDKNISQNKNRLVDLDFADNNGQTALHKAAKNGDAAIVKILVLAGADRSKQDRWGNTPLHIAAKQGFIDVVKELLVSLDLNGREIKDGHAIKESRMKNGLKTENNNGFTPAQAALRSKYKSVAELLLNSSEK